MAQDSKKASGSSKTKAKAKPAATKSKTTTSNSNNNNSAQAAADERRLRKLKVFLKSISFNGSEGVRFETLNDLYFDHVLTDEFPCSDVGASEEYRCNPTPFIVASCFNRTQLTANKGGGGARRAPPRRKSSIPLKPSQTKTTPTKIGKEKNDSQRDGKNSVAGNNKSSNIKEEKRNSKQIESTDSTEKKPSSNSKADRNCSEIKQQEKI